MLSLQELEKRREERGLEIVNKDSQGVLDKNKAENRTH